MSDFKKYIDKLENGELKDKLRYFDEEEVILFEYHFNKYHQEKVKENELLHSVISRLNEMNPKQEFIEFDKTKKNDWYYCVEFGLIKQRWIESGIYQKYIDELNDL